MFEFRWSSDNRTVPSGVQSTRRRQLHRDEQTGEGCTSLGSLQRPRAGPTEVSCLWLFSIPEVSVKCRRFLAVCLVSDNVPSLLFINDTYSCYSDSTEFEVFNLKQFLLHSTFHSTFLLNLHRHHPHLLEQRVQNYLFFSSFRIVGFTDAWPKLEKWFSRFGILQQVDANTTQGTQHVTVLKLLQCLSADCRFADEGN